MYFYTYAIFFELCTNSLNPFFKCSVKYVTQRKFTVKLSESYEKFIPGKYTAVYTVAV